MHKWIKIALIGTPLVFATSLYAFANEKPISRASITIEKVQPEAVVTTEQTTSNLEEIPNPFLVSNEQSQSRQSDTVQAVAQTTANQTLSMDTIRKLHMKAKTDQGELKLEYHVEGNGTPRLNGEIGSVKVHLSGDKARDLMNNLLNRWDLLGTLQQIMANPGTKVNNKAVFALVEFEMETVDGREIEFEPDHPEAKARQKHEDNGKHKGNGKQDGKEKKHEEHDDDDEKEDD
ncbi:hypothetical protein [Effusibacillus lacus]|uniref:Uncharacterized protein n=1 Tax=Effusibacillus lacus TaxID=1348429 RepID=A0A292YNJ4_9BACL|nr:hypothetical protein [Effusibacillus lacus]TCS71434.1 hypothetical protein EDD64_12652 [Effusibacillus lacus]GAX89964.1 hypothetical protein EFBL_1590 [Effusibacillus lacus]